jgi:hypothetical protein
LPRTPKKKPAKQLNREIAEVLSRSQPSSGGNGGHGMARVTRERVHEPSCIAPTRSPAALTPGCLPSFAAGLCRSYLVVRTGRGSQGSS